ncbi:MAG: flagellar basal body-associated FliL family protein [Granulosicoccus sp.]|nr:flagellar basal body-associated FliL family protein [Granulosicoccus sp.]
MNIKKILIFGGGAMLLVGASVGGTMFLTGAFDKAAMTPGMQAALPGEDMAKAAPLPALPEEVFYYNIQPEFIVNFYGKSRTKLMMIEMVVGTHDKKLLPIFSDHDPEIRDSLLTLLSEQDSEELKTVAGKQALRESAIERLDELVGRYYRTGRIKDVYITRLVMQ